LCPENARIWLRLSGKKIRERIRNWLKMVHFYRRGAGSPKLNADCRFGVNQLDTSYAEQYNTLRSRAHRAVRDPALPIDLAVHSRNLFRSYGYQKLRRFDNGYTDYNYTYYDY
jgi:hypothetical protein